MERLESFGWAPAWASAFRSLELDENAVPARVAEEHRGVLRLFWAGGELDAEVAGRFRHRAQEPAALPGVGDWVAVVPRPEEKRGTIVAVVPRRGALIRKAVDRAAEAQLLAANVDTVFVTSSSGAEINPRRIERTLALAREGGAQGVVVLTKKDLAEDLAASLTEAFQAAGSHPVVAVSAVTGEGLEELAPFLVPAQTVALLGPSGVGKSTLVNRLVGSEELATSATREGDDKGRHTTTHRQMLLTASGAILIDTPGLREIGLWEDSGGVESAFADIEALMSACRFHDCGHSNEPGCAVQEALADGGLSQERLESFRKLSREAMRLAARRDKRARHEERKAQKKFSKKIRNLPNKKDWR